MGIKLRANGLVAKAIRNGTLRRRPCERCGNPKAEGHHEDYSKPLDVTWLCRKHHRIRHAEMAYQYQAETVTNEWSDTPMDQIDRDIVELEARIAEFRATPHTKEPVMSASQRPAIKRTSVVLTPDIQRALDQFRRNYDGPMPSESEAIRELMLKGLMHHHSKAKREAKP